MRQLSKVWKMGVRKAQVCVRSAYFKNLYILGPIPPTCTVHIKEAIPPHSIPYIAMKFDRADFPAYPGPIATQPPPPNFKYFRKVQSPARAEGFGDPRFRILGTPSH